VSGFRITVLASGTGSLFQALIDNQNIHNAKIVGLICDRDCPALERAAAAKIPAQVTATNSDKTSWDLDLLKTLDNYESDLIISAGFMRLIGQAVLTKYEGRIINTHPALLPNFPGAHAVRDALAAKASITGSTIHFIDSGIDTGEIITQRQVEVFSGDTEDSLHERIKVVERELLVKVVSDFVSGKIKTRPRS
jgi:phosphoribosylglycinamide formyltransferase-1